MSGSPAHALRKHGYVQPVRGARHVPLAILAAFVVVPPLVATGQLSPLNDLLSLGHAGGQTPARVATVRRAEPPFEATPRANCLPGSRKEPGIQGRVPDGAAANGLHCNVDLLARQGSSGGFKVHRYVDRRGRECAFYDTALLYPLNALKLSGDSQGVAVLDMSNPRKPVQTATLREIPMNSPHESLALNARRGLLAAVMGNPSTYPGLVSIYDVSQDCRKPVLQATRPVARLGHESGFAQDGKTFYATGTAVEAISAIDVTDPKNPHSIWQGNVVSHGMSLSADGNRGYIADVGGELLILDLSEIQARRPNPEAKEVARLTWRAASIPQNAIPFSVSGKPYLLETDEYTQGTSGGGNSNEVGAARIIDISDERKPKVDREPAPPGEPARRPREGRERPRRQQPGAGLRRALLRRLDPEGPDRGGLLVHRLRPAGVRHQRPDQAQGDRLLRAAVGGSSSRTRSTAAASPCPSRRWCRAGARCGSATV